MTTTTISQSDEGIVFHDIPHRDQSLDCVELRLEAFDSDQIDQYFVLPKDSPVLDGWSIADSELTFQLLRRLHDLREDPVCKRVVKKARAALQRILSDGIRTATRIDLANSDAPPEYHFCSDSPLTGHHEKTTPPFLALDDWDRNDHLTNELTPRHDLIYRTLFGEGYEDALDILTYFCPQKPRRFGLFRRKPVIPTTERLSFCMRYRIDEDDQGIPYTPVNLRSRMGPRFEIIADSYMAPKTLGVRVPE